MKTRIISSIILLPPLIYVLLKGGFLLALTVLIVTLIGVYEFSHTLDKYIAKNERYVLYTVAIINITTLYIGGQNAMLSTAFLLLLIEGTLVILEKITPENAVYTIFTYMYICLPLSCIYAISKNHSEFFWYIFIFSMVTDTMAYFTGRFFGKHKLSPKLSPKKTVEGALGGVLGCVIASLIYSILANKGLVFILQILVFSAIGSLVSQVGDIFASSFKRWTGIKDYGDLIPGHGGILDRLDSILFSSAYVFIIAHMF